MGGPSMGGASTPFQELSINAPRLQPQAAPVTSFTQASKPNAPGAPVLSKPQLTPEPAEISNLQRLANELGSLNTNLQQFGTAAIQFGKVRDENRREDAKALSRISYGQFPGQSLLDYRDKVEKLVKSHPEDTEAKAMLVIDPWPDKNAVNDAIKIGIPVIGLCDTNNQSNNLDLVVPCNNKGKKSIGLLFFLLAKHYALNRGLIKSEKGMKS